jgi:drug/metabolite transporter (DMT)-like permease
MANASQVIIGIILGFASAFIWATTSLAIKAQSDRIDTSSFNAFRMFVAMLFVLALLPFFGGVQAIVQMPVNATLMLAISSVIGIAIGDTLYFWSMTKIGTSRALPISGTYPLFTWALAVPLLNEPITLGAILGTILVIAGVSLLAPQTEKTIQTDARTERWGLLAVFAAALLWAIATTMLKIGLNESPHVIVVNAIRLPVAAAASALIAYRQKGWAAWRGYNRKSLPALVGLAIYSTGIGMIVWTLTVDFAGAARASLINTAAPIIGVPLAAIFLKENVTPKIVVGTLLSVLGIWLII